MRWLATPAILCYGAHLALGQFVPTVEDMDNWLATTSANVTFVLNSNFDAPVTSSDIRIIACSKRTGNTCGGDCWAYQAPQGGQCMPFSQGLFETVCFGMTGNLPVCNGTLCGGECSVYTNCRALLDNKFCYAPEAKSVQFYQFGPNPNSLSLSSSAASASASRSRSVTSSLSSSSGSAGSSPFPSTVLSPTDMMETQSQTLPVGTILGIAIGSVFVLLSILLSFCYFRRRQYRKRNPSSEPEPFTAAGWATLATVLPGPQYLRPKKTTRLDDSPDGPSSTSNLFETDPSSSDVSTPMEITHKDSGVRIASSSYPPSPRVVVEHPPPYTTA